MKVRLLTRIALQEAYTRGNIPFNQLKPKGGRQKSAFGISTLTQAFVAEHSYDIWHITGWIISKGRS